ncbi:hypothetical protein BD410DRAFT_810159 [Rickenella mellea]|uniref:Uncharacterized protein n=1 Tax=Rickenella mellea TaxID=50990 RepID=A0A4Y7PH70_9AGAM|nr:hypothetical protein BD410DRAFT_810159 [Rickenella mellea]
MPLNALTTPAQRRKTRFNRLVAAGRKIFDKIPAEWSDQEDIVSLATALYTTVGKIELVLLDLEDTVGIESRLAEFKGWKTCLMNMQFDVSSDDDVSVTSGGTGDVSEVSENASETSGEVGNDDNQHEVGEVSEDVSVTSGELVRGAFSEGESDTLDGDASQSDQAAEQEAHPPLDVLTDSDNDSFLEDVAVLDGLEQMRKTNRAEKRAREAFKEGEEALERAMSNFRMKRFKYAQANHAAKRAFEHYLAQQGFQKLLG